MAVLLKRAEKDLERLHEYADAPSLGIQGKVTAIRADGFVGISLGSDDGLLAGERLDDFRVNGRIYLGKVEVIKIEPDKAVCKVLPEYRKGQIEANDRVVTGLKKQ